MKKIFLLLSVAFISTIALARDFPYGQYDQQAMDMKRYEKDTSAHAVVLKEYGTSRISMVTDDESLKLVYQYHVKIKIFDSQGFKSGTIGVRIEDHGNDREREDISDITGTTCYKDENGRHAVR